MLSIGSLHPAIERACGAPCPQSFSPCGTLPDATVGTTFEPIWTDDRPAHYALADDIPRRTQADCLTAASPAEPHGAGT